MMKLLGYSALKHQKWRREKTTKSNILVKNTSRISSQLNGAFKIYDILQFTFSKVIYAGHTNLTQYTKECQKR